jgi:Dyp-type peroxidase family
MSVMSIDLGASNLDHHDPMVRPLLDNLQGNILKGHGRKHVRLVCLRFEAPPQQVRSWLRCVAAAWITSAWRQLAERDDVKGKGAPGGTFGNLFLSAAGYAALGQDPSRLDPPVPPPAVPGAPPPVQFAGGMKAAAELVGDPAPAEWQEPYQGGEIHAMILLADNDPARLGAAAEEVERGMAGSARVVARETGQVLRNSSHQAVEPFGFADGLSQPLFLADDLAQEPSPRLHWQPEAPLDLVLVPDPFVVAEDCCGSFLVYRKLEQDVEGFARQIEQLASSLGRNPQQDPDLARARALVVGRFQDGTPLIDSDHPSGAASNDFDDSQDPTGARCPVHSHIRKANPRGASVRTHQHANLAQERQRRIVRRGIPYGLRRPGEAPPPAGAGLLFMCFQSSIANQFAFIQQKWVNDVSFPNVGNACLDPLAGRMNGSDPQLWPCCWGSNPSVRFDFHGFVTLKGGEFFFAPSLAFLLG